MLFLNTKYHTSSMISKSLFKEGKKTLWPQPLFFSSKLTIHPFSPTSEMSHISPAAFPLLFSISLLCNT